MKLFSNDSPLENTSFRAIIFAEIMAITLHVIFLVVFYINDIKPLYYYNFFSIALYLSTIYIALNYYHYLPYTIIAIVFEVLSHQFLAIYLLGWDYGFQYFFIAIAAYFAIGGYVRFAIPLILTVISFICLITTYLLSNYTIASYSMSDQAQESFYLLNMVMTFLITSTTPLIYSFSVKKYQSILLYESNTDTLTKLNNRKRAMELIREEFSRNNREQSEFILSIADIDNFKRINDTYGHDIGDAVLVEIAHVVQKELRQHDIKARWGGEEFLFMLPDTNIDNGIITLNKLRKSISKIKVPLGKSKIKVTMTFGIASSKSSHDPENILKYADNALYQGKRNGKDQVVQALNDLT